MSGSPPELARLTAALAGGAQLSSVLEAIQLREDRRREIAMALVALQGNGNALADHLDAVLPEAQRRLQQWRSVLAEETAPARRMLRTLLTQGRLVFTPQPDEDAVEFQGRGDFGQLFAGLIPSQALASPSIPSWNQIATFLESMRQLSAIRGLRGLTP